MKFNQPIVVLLGCLLPLAIIATLIDQRSNQSSHPTSNQQLFPAQHNPDDVQYFPAGPEFLLSKQVQAFEQYRKDRQADIQSSSSDSH
jgi:hypothetical protein